MKKAFFAVLALALVAGTALVPAPAQAQQQQAPAPPQSWDEAALRSFNNIHNKLIAMAKDPKFPADKENYKPHPESRSFNEELAHVIAPLVSSVIRINGGDREAMRVAINAIPKDRAGIAAAMEKAKADYLAAWEKTKPFGIIGLTEHQGEHYGKLVTIYRINGLVPPGSRQGE